MLAPLIGPANKASRPTVPPMARAAVCVTARVSVATAVMTNIKKKVSAASRSSDWPFDPRGSVAPRWATVPNIPRSSRLAAIAPPHWASRYGPTRDHGKWRAQANASVTAGLKCAPEICPTALIITKIIRLNVSPIPTCVTPPPVVASMITAPVPANTSANVPTPSASIACVTSRNRARSRRRRRRWLVAVTAAHFHIDTHHFDQGQCKASRVSRQ